MQQLTRWIAVGSFLTNQSLCGLWKLRETDFKRLVHLDNQSHNLWRKLVNAIGSCILHSLYKITILNTPDTKCCCSKIRIHSMHEFIVNQNWYVCQNIALDTSLSNLEFWVREPLIRFWETSCLNDKTILNTLEQKVVSFDLKDSFIKVECGPWLTSKQIWKCKRYWKHRKWSLLIWKKAPSRF
jgi:hypothetical protein